MAREVIQKRAYCKRAVFVDGRQRPILQVKVAEALGKLKKVGTRKEQLGEDGRYVRSVIYYREYANMLFGIVAGYERGTHQLTVSEDDDAEMLTVEQVAPPEHNDKKRREFLEGICYFGIMGNHVVVIPSRPLGPKPFEAHLNWLMHVGGALPDENAVGLSDHVASTTRKKIQQSHAKSVEIGTPLLNAADTDNANRGTLEAGSKVKSFEYAGLGLEILRQVIGPDKMDRMKLADAVDGNIEVTLKVQYKRKTTKEAHKVMDNIAMAVRHLDEDDVKITLAGGGTLRGSDLKLFTPLSVEARDGIPNPDELFSKARAWLLDLIKNETIEP